MCILFYFDRACDHAQALQVISVVVAFASLLFGAYTCSGTSEEWLQILTLKRYFFQKVHDVGIQ